MLKNTLIIALIALSLAACSKKPAVDLAHPPNILLIVLDAARADHFSCYGYQRRTTPELDRIAGEGVRFTRAVSTSSWTLPAHASLFTGLMPDEHGAHNRHAWLVDRIPTLAGLLKERGYRTGCFTNSPIIDQYHNLVRGFEVIERVWADSAVITEERPHNSEYTNTRVRAFAGEGGGRPFFAFINYMDVHQPYAAPEPFRSMYLERGEEITARLDSACRYADLLDKGAVKLTEAEKTALAGIYDGCLTYLDSRVGELLQALRDDGLYDSTLIIITSDHGECFGEYGKYGHGDLLNRPLIHIPLLVRYPALFPSPKVRSELVSIADIFHGLSRLLDLRGAAVTGLPMRDIFAGKIKEEPCYSSFFLGRMPKEEIRQHFDTHSVWTPANRHYILRGAEAVECFDLNADYTEQRNLCPAEVAPREVESAVAAERKKLAMFVEDNQDLKITGELKFDPQVVRAMRALGYVGGGNNSDLIAQAQLKEHPHFLEHFKTGNFFFSLDSLAAAETELRIALEMSPQNERLRIKFSFILYRNGKYEETLNTLHPLISRTGYEKETFLILGLTFKALGKVDRALEYFGKASELQPARLDVALNAAELLLGLRRFEEAGVYVERIMSHHYGNLPVLLNVLVFYLKNDNPAGARDLLLNLQKKARSGTVYGLLAHVYEVMGQKKEADDCRMQAAALGMSGARLSRLEQSLKDAEVQQNKEP